MQLLESHNQCPNGVWMELEAIPKANAANQFELYLNLKYHEQSLEILEGKVKFGLRSSKLLLTLENLVFVEKQTINSPFITFVNNVFSSQLIWEIRHKGDSKFLQCDLENLKLGVVEVKSSVYQLTAEIIAKKSDVLLTNIEGLWYHDITPNKHAILERKLAEFIEKTQLKSYISRTIFSHQNDNIIPYLHKEEKLDILEEENIKLKKVIRLIYQNTKNSFTELTNIAGLNLFTDFSGGDLTGVNFSGLNLSGSNFSFANLRGADLTDTDLSEANLQYVKLNGADLSGAYLEGAYLQNASLQNASLALANIIGANLSQANLTNTNLQNTSLGKINVKNTIFSNNLGLDDEKKEELKKEGAIIL